MQTIRNYCGFNFHANNINRIYRFTDKERLVITKNMSKKKQEIAIRNNTILDLLEDGFTISEIAKRLNVCVHTVRRFLKKDDLLKKSAENLKNIVLQKLWSGESIKEVAKSLSIKEFFVENLSQQNKVFQTLKSERDKKIIELAKEGVFVKDIANQLNLSRSRVNVILNEFFKESGTKIIINNSIKKRQEQIKEALMQGMSRKDVAKKFNVCLHTVINIAQENGIYRQVKDNRDKAILDLASKGISYKQIAQSFNISVATVKRVLMAQKNKLKE